MCLHTQSQTKNSEICFLSDQHRQLKALCDRQQRWGWVAPERTQYPTSKLCDPKQQPSFNTGIVWFGILVQDTKKKTFFMLYLRRLKLIFFWQSALLYKRYLVQEMKQCWKINNLSWKCKSPLSALSAMLTSTSCNYAALPLTARVTSKEKYSRVFFFACAFSFQIQGDGAWPVQTYFHGCGCQLLYNLLYSVFWWRKVGQRGKKPGWAGRAWKDLTSITSQLGGVWHVTLLFHLMVFPVEMGTEPHF